MLVKSVHALARLDRPELDKAIGSSGHKLKKSGGKEVNINTFVACI